MKESKQDRAARRAARNLPKILAAEREARAYRDIFTPEEQAEIDAELCQECGERFDQHDGRELHRFRGR